MNLLINDIIDLSLSILKIRLILNIIDGKNLEKHANYMKDESELIIIDPQPFDREKPA
jgi:hypothetical protein